jgi:uncharacterized YigZ family protein
MSEKPVLTVRGESVSEKIIEKSRFITYSTHVESEDEARSFIARIRGEHSLATHVCFAFVADKQGNLCRFSDDGEPQGTAGMPILDVLKNKNLKETAVAVVRYFGGVKLGAGGLVRAYSSSASENLAAAKLCTVELCSKWELSTDYPCADALQKFISTHECNLLSTEYDARVRFVVAVKKAEEESFIHALVDYMQGKVDRQKTAEYYAPFEV